MSAKSPRNNGESLNVRKALTEACNEESADLSLSMREVLTGFLTEVGGASEFGRECARLFKSPDTSTSTKMTTATNLMKLMGVYGGDEDSDELTPDAMLDRWEELQRMEGRRETLDRVNGSQ